MNRREAVTLMVAVLVPLPACAGSVPSVAFDLDACEQCRMTISDRRYAAAATTAGGRTVRFDSLECLAAWIADADEAPRALWVTDALAPGVLVPIASVRFHRGAPGSTPMGMGFVAVRADAGSTPWDGTALTWDEVRAAVAREGLGGTPTGHGGH